MHHREIERSGQPAHRRRRQLRLDPHGAAEKLRGGDAAEHHLRVRHRGGLARSVAGRAGNGARALGTHAQEAARVHARDRPATGAHGVNVQHGHAHRHAVHVRLGGFARRAGGQAHVRGGAAHVEGQDLFEARAARHLHGGNQAARGSGQHGAHGVAARLPGREIAAVGLKDRNAVPARTTGLERGEVAIHQRTHVGVDGGGGGALILAELGRDFVRRADVAEPRQRLGHGALIGGIAIGVQEADGHALHALGLERGPQTPQLRRRRAPLDFAIEKRAFVDTEVQLRRNDGRVRPGREIVEFAPVLAANQEQVLEAGRGDQRRADALALEQRVGGDGGAMHHLDARARAYRGAAQAFENNGVRSARIGADFEALETPVVMQDDEVREGAARIYADSQGSE